MKRLLKVMSVFAVTLVAAMFMVACGSSNGGTNNPDNPNNTTTNICNIDNLNGFYANIAEQKLYYFENTANGDLGGLPGRFSLVSEEPDENGLYHLRVNIGYPAGGKYAAKLKVERHRSPEMVVIYHEWSDGERVETLLISTYNNDDNKDLSKQFYAEDEKIIYTKISGLEEFLAEVFPDKDIDTTDMTYVADGWEDLIEAL